MSLHPDLDRLAGIYTSKRTKVSAMYSLMNPPAFYLHYERKAKLVNLLRQAGYTSLSNLRILDVGCGVGTNILDFIQLGASPQLLAGCDLLKDRIDIARSSLPSSVSLYDLPVSNLPFPDNHFDICYVSLVFSSLLSKDVRHVTSDSISRILKPGGIVIVYDFYRDNPFNNDVMPVTIKDLRNLFPEYNIILNTLTLAPPITRRLPRFLFLYLFRILSFFPFLRTHFLAVLHKSKK